MDRLNHTAVPGPSTPSRREQLSSVVIKRKDDNAIEIDMLKDHGRDEVLQFGIAFAAGLLNYSGVVVPSFRESSICPCRCLRRATCRAFGHTSLVLRCSEGQSGRHGGGAPRWLGGPATAAGSVQKPTGGPICQASHAAPKLGRNIRPVTRNRWWAALNRTGV